MQNSLPTILLLCAGKSQRFQALGGEGSKLNAMIGPKTVKEHVLTCIKQSMLPHLIVEPEDTSDLPNPGMGTSIAWGVSRTPQANGWLILPADLPLIKPSTLKAVAQELMQANLSASFHSTIHPSTDANNNNNKKNNISGNDSKLDTHTSPPFCVAPLFDGERGHPVGFSKALGHQLMSLQGDTGAREILITHTPKLIIVDDPGCVMDVDTPQLLEAARAHWRLNLAS
jgi:molybdenum cofactor cytidylyltransferase